MKDWFFQKAAYEPVEMDWGPRGNGKSKFGVFATIFRAKAIPMEWISAYSLTPEEKSAAAEDEFLKKKILSLWTKEVNWIRSGSKHHFYPRNLYAIIGIYCRMSVTQRNQSTWEALVGYPRDWPTSRLIHFKGTCCSMKITHIIYCHWIKHKLWALKR